MKRHPPAGALARARRLRREMTDAEREQEGYRLIRFWNHEMLGNPDGVWSVLVGVLHNRHPTPTPPLQGEGR